MFSPKNGGFGGRNIENGRFSMFGYQMAEFHGVTISGFFWDSTMG
jgi:hypothetical protein